MVCNLFIHSVHLTYIYYLFIYLFMYVFMYSFTIRVLHIPCSAHIIQLVAKRLTNHPTVKPALDTMFNVIQKAAHNKAFRLKVANMAKDEKLPVHLIKPNDTRWNSTLAAVERFVQLKRVIQYLEGKLKLHIYLFICLFIFYCSLNFIYLFICLLFICFFILFLIFISLLL